jgi:hypothetical protein
MVSVAIVSYCIFTQSLEVSVVFPVCSFIVILCSISLHLLGGYVILYYMLVTKLLIVFVLQESALCNAGIQFIC